MRGGKTMKRYTYQLNEDGLVEWMPWATGEWVRYKDAAAAAEAHDAQVRKAALEKAARYLEWDAGDELDEADPDGQTRLREAAKAIRKQAEKEGE